MQHLVHNTVAALTAASTQIQTGNHPVIPSAACVPSHMPVSVTPHALWTLWRPHGTPLLHQCIVAGDPSASRGFLVPHNPALAGATPDQHTTMRLQLGAISSRWFQRVCLNSTPSTTPLQAPLTSRAKARNHAFKHICHCTRAQLPGRQLPTCAHTAVTPNLMYAHTRTSCTASWPCFHLPCRFTNKQSTCAAVNDSPSASLGVTAACQPTLRLCTLCASTTPRQPTPAAGVTHQPTTPARVQG